MNIFILQWVVMWALAVLNIHYLLEYVGIVHTKICWSFYQVYDTSIACQAINTANHISLQIEKKLIGYNATTHTFIQGAVSPKSGSHDLAASK